MTRFLALLSTNPGQSARALLLAALMVVSALTEGVGLLLLVPMLGALGGNPSELPQILGRLGVPITLGSLLVFFVALVALRGSVNLARSVIAQAFQSEVVDSLRRRAWHALLHCEWRSLLEMRRASTASVLITTSDQIAIGVQAAISGIAAGATLATLLLAALAISPAVAGGAVLAGGMVMVAYRQLRRRAAALGEELGQTYDAVHLHLGESLAALRTIKLLGREDRAEVEAFDGFTGLAASRKAYVSGVSLGQLVLQTGGAIVLAMLIWLAIERWNLGLASILPLVALFARALPLLGAVQEGMQNWSHARPALDATLALIDRAEQAPEAPVGTLVPPNLSRELQLSRVTVQFAGQDRPALDRIDLTLRAGEVIAVTGSSGAGKSTLADLLGGLIAPDQGTIAIDGVLLDRTSQRAWRQRTGYVEQDPVLLSATLRDNLLWAAPEASDSRLEAALRDAAAGFATSLQHGLDTRLGDGGRRLSGGERQRLMLARILLREPQLLILDEATNALDPASEAAIGEVIGMLRGRVTIVIVAHRGDLLALADRVVTLDRGRIIHNETHSQGLSKSEEFTDYSAIES